MMIIMTIRMVTMTIMLITMIITMSATTRLQINSIFKCLASIDVLCYVLI